MTATIQAPEASLSPAVREIVRAVSVSPDRTRAVVGDQEIEADTPRELRRMLAETLYDVFHSGQRAGYVPARLRDQALEDRLAAVVPHERITVRAVVRSAARRDTDGNVHVLVEREGVRFWAPESALATTDAEPGDTVDLRVPSARPGLSPGFFLVDGTKPRRGGQDVLRIYVHVTDAEHAPGVWGEALAFLEERGIPYRAKVLSAPELYPRRDAVVVYLDDDTASIAPELAETVRRLPGVGRDVSSFVEELRPGVATAREPVDDHPGMRGLSFGQHRASVLAAALVDSAEDPSTAERLVVERFVAARIDPATPARNRPAD